MRILGELRSRFRGALEDLVDEDVDDLLKMVRPSQDSRFGDYQANCAMPLAKRLGESPRQIAAKIVERLSLDDLCHAPEIAGPGFINLRLRDAWLSEQLQAAAGDDRLGIEKSRDPLTIVIDYSSPNVAKPMHVGHIRSTVIGDAIYRTLSFLGHRAIADNHLGDWGTQFGMIIYGYKHFRQEEAFEKEPVHELARLYKLVNQLVEYHNGEAKISVLRDQLEIQQRELDASEAEEVPQDKSEQKKRAKGLRKLSAQLGETKAELARLLAKKETVEKDPALAKQASEHSQIATAVLEETAKLHAGDAENQSLWEAFLPACRKEIERVYERLQICFDHEYGESFYHDRLSSVVADLEQRGLARESNQAICLFLDGFDAPMIVRKQDGAFLYATTDLATIQFRMETWDPDLVLYVVDHRQSEHFEKLFAAAQLWGYTDVDLRHISFGTVLGEDGKPYKTRAGDTIGLEGLLDEAVRRAQQVIAENAAQKPAGTEAIPETEQRAIARAVGHGAIKYADLSHNRTSDYVFSYDKMLALNGNTATYLQYSYARVQGIFGRSGEDPSTVKAATISLGSEAERTLALWLLRFADALDEMVEDFRPNLLTGYLFEMAKAFSTFFEKCPVLKAENNEVRVSRLALCALTGRTIKQGLALLGIEVVDRM